MGMLSLLALLASTPFGRVSHIEGRLALRGPTDTAPAAVVTGALLRGGEQLSAPVGSFAEVELDGGVALRIAGGTLLIVERIEGELVATIFAGALDVAGASHAVGLRALGSRIRAERGARLRVDVDRDGARAFVRARQQGARLQTPHEQLGVGPEKLLTLVPGFQTTEPWDGVEDAFDRLVAERIARRAERAALRPLLLDGRAGWLSSEQPAPTIEMTPSWLVASAASYALSVEVEAQADVVVATVLPPSPSAPLYRPSPRAPVAPAEPPATPASRARAPERRDLVVHVPAPIVRRPTSVVAPRPDEPRVAPPLPPARGLPTPRTVSNRPVRPPPQMLAPRAAPPRVVALPRPAAPAQAAPRSVVQPRPPAPIIAAPPVRQAPAPRLGMPSIGQPAPVAAVARGRLPARAR